jgi:hypothetical protein
MVGKLLFIQDDTEYVIASVQVASFRCPRP